MMPCVMLNIKDQKEKMLEWVISAKGKWSNNLLDISILVTELAQNIDDSFFGSKCHQYLPSKFCYQF